MACSVEIFLKEKGLFGHLLSGKPSYSASIRDANISDDLTSFPTPAALPSPWDQEVAVKGRLAGGGSSARWIAGAVAWDLKT